MKGVEKRREEKGEMQIKLIQIDSNPLALAYILVTLLYERFEFSYQMGVSKLGLLQN